MVASQLGSHPILALFLCKGVEFRSEVAGPRAVLVLIMSTLIAIILLVVSVFSAAAADAPHRTTTIDTFTGPRAHLDCTCALHAKEGYDCNSCFVVSDGRCQCSYGLKIYN